MMFEYSPDQDNYQIILLRHGQSVGNAEGRYQGQSNFPLNDTGRAQAQALARRWAAEGIAFDRIISSPLLRARETADIIAAALNTPIEEDALWQERDNGLLSGMRAEEAAEKHPRPAFFTPYTPVGDTGEGQWDLFLRAGKAVRELIRRPPGRYLVVSHGGLLNMVLYAMLGIIPQANFHGARFRFRNAAFASLLYRPGEHMWVLNRLNDRQHWDSIDEGARI